MKSSFGAIFSLCAEEVLNQREVVFGAAFDKNFEVPHIVVDNYKDLPKNQGSKYMQSRIENTYKEVEAHLKLGKNSTLFWSRMSDCRFKKLSRKGI